nr:MAG TPA: hypothetical protein [Bacteriophage sp.]
MLFCTILGCFGRHFTTFLKFSCGFWLKFHNI